MNCTAYQKEAHKFAAYGGNANYPALGLCEEAGEVAGKIAKFIRKHNGVEPQTIDNAKLLVDKKIMNADFIDDCQKFRNDICKELGDVCWMVAELCTVFELNLDDVLDNNIVKLTDRAERGVIIGEGDNR